MPLLATIELAELSSHAAHPLPRSSSAFLCSWPKNRPPRRSPCSGHLGPIPLEVSILVPSSTFPNQHPFLCPPPASSPRAPSCRGYGCRSRRSQPPPPVPIATKVESLHPPLSPRALGFGIGGRNRRTAKLQRASTSPMADGVDEQEAALSVYSLVSANLVNTCRNIEPTNPKSHTSLCWAVQPKDSIQATHKQAMQHLLKHVTHNQYCFLFSELIKYPILQL